MNMNSDTMRKVAVATFKEEPVWPSAHSGTNQSLDDIQILLLKQDIQLVPVPWDSEGVDWTQFALVLVTHVSNYTKHADDFRKWLDTLQASGVQVLNPPKLVRWNMDKSYMLGLQQSGFPVVDTVVVTSAEFMLAKAVKVADNRKWQECVIKPAIASCSDFCYKIKMLPNQEYSTDDNIDLSGLKAFSPRVLLQEFIPSIETDGEFSVSLIEGRAIFAFLKFPPRGDFRLGVIAPDIRLVSEPPEQLLRLAEAVVSSLAEVPLYARLDLLKDRCGQYLIAELEVIEPSMFFNIYPAANEIFVKAIRNRMSC